MAKGQKRSTKEARKPKKATAKKIAPLPTIKSLITSQGAKER